jgi:hypothetical protein
MRWIENITIYSAAGVRNNKIIGLLTQFSHDESLPSPEKITIYKHSKLENELGIMIYWESEKATTDKSTLGLRIAEILKEFGMINHYVWVEEKSF